METYLSDIFISSVGNDKALLRRFIEATPEFKTEKVSIAEICKAMEDLEKKARSYLLDVVWHRLNRGRVRIRDKRATLYAPARFFSPMRYVDASRCSDGVSIPNRSVSPSGG